MEWIKKHSVDLFPRTNDGKVTSIPIKIMIIREDRNVLSFLSHRGRKLENVILEEDYIIGGMKTESGKNRKVPIHPDIKKLVEDSYHHSQEVCKTGFLFNIQKGTRWFGLTYDQYKYGFSRVMQQFFSSVVPAILEVQDYSAIILQISE